MKKILIVSLTVAFIAVLLLGGVGCKEEATETTNEATEETAATETTTAKTEDIKVGFSLAFVEAAPYIFPFSEALEDSAKRLGWELNMTDAKGDINVQANQVEDLAASGIDGLLVQPVDAAGIVPILDKVHSEYPDLVILISNAKTDPEEIDAAAGFAGPSSYLEAKQMAEYYINYVDEMGYDVINYCHMTGMAGMGPAIERENGFNDALKEAGVESKFNVLDLQPGDWSTDTAQAVTENWLTAYGDQIQMIYCHNDGMALGVVNALKAAGIEPGKILVNGCDGQPSAIQMIKDGWILFTIFQSPFSDAELSMDTMARILNGEDVDYFTYLETPIVEESNADEYLQKAIEVYGEEF